MAKRRFASFFVAAITITVIALPPAAADSQAERMIATDTGIQGTTTLNFSSGSEPWDPSVMFTYQKVPGGPGAIEKRDTAICGIEGIEKCAPAGVEFNFRATFPPCENESSTNCIESLWAVDESGRRIQGVMQHQLNAPNRFPGDIARHIPAGEGSSIWKIPGANGSGSDLFAVVVGQAGRYKDTFSSSRSVIDDTFATIQPVEILPRNVPDFSTRDQQCQVFDTTLCAARESFVANSRYGLKIRFQDLPLTWFRGRMDQPEIMITPSTDSREIVQVVASPITVPFVTASAKWSDFSPTLKALYPGDPEYLRSSFGHAVWGAVETGDVALLYFKEWQPFIKDHATAMKSYWSLHSINFEEAPRPGVLHVDHGTLFECSAGVPIAGVVTSNALVYDNGPPTFNRQTQTLDYKVAAPHFTSAGEVLIGSYNLKINSEVARCIYGFSQAPINASIEIIDETGTVRVATSSVSELNGYLNLHAGGFTYSSPLLKVKLTQPKTIVADAGQSPVTTNGSAKSGQVSSVAGIKILSKGISYYLENLKPSANGIPFLNKDMHCGATLSKIASDGTRQIIPANVVPETKTTPGRLVFDYEVGKYQIVFCGSFPDPIPFEISSGTDPHTAPPLPFVTKVILKSISCVKGKIVKKVTAVNPKCPVGYKKK